MPGGVTWAAATGIRGFVGVLPGPPALPRPGASAAGTVQRHHFEAGLPQYLQEGVDTQKI